MRLAADAAHEFGGIELDRRKPLSFRLDGRRVTGFAGDTVLSAALACGIDTFGMRAGQPLGLGERFAPLIRFGQGGPLPMERTPAIDNHRRPLVVTCCQSRRWELNPQPMA